MITVRLPVVVDMNLLAFALMTAKNVGSELQIEVFYRLKGSEDGFVVDCDSQKELREYISHSLRVGRVERNDRSPAQPEPEPTP